MLAKTTDENFFASEQRRFRRLEVSLPVWLALESDWNREGRNAWTLGYTRDISILCARARRTRNGTIRFWRIPAARLWI